MSVGSRLVFDPTEAASSQNVGAYIRAGSDGDLIASQTISAEEWLNVAAAMFAGDGTAIGQTGGSLDVNVTNSLGIDVDLDHTEDSVAVGDGGSLTATITTVGPDNGLDVNIINTAVTVSATDLDIRSLDHTSGGANDSVRLGDGTDLITSTLVGSDQGLDVNVINDISVEDVALADTAIAAGTTAISVAAVNMKASALPDRKYFGFFNNANKSVYLGPSGVTAGTGFPLDPGVGHMFRIGPNLDVYAIGETGASSEDIRYIELS